MNKFFNLLLASIFFALSSNANAHYKLTILGTLGGSASWATSINNFGQIVGTSYTAANTDWHATLWNGATVTDLGALGGLDSNASAINDRGQVVGYAFANGQGQAALWSESSAVALTGNGGFTNANGINNAGQVVGLSGQNAVLWNGTSITVLPTLGGNYSSANDINNTGLIVGSSTVKNDIYSYGFLSDGINAIKLDALYGGYSSFASRINDAGQVVGASSNITGNRYQATLWNSSTPTALETLGGNSSYALGINNAGKIVGQSLTDRNDGYHATLWNDTIATDLNNFLSDNERTAGWILRVASDINDLGWIVGSASNSLTNEYLAFLLVTENNVPEPETFALMLAGLGLMGAFTRRRKQSAAAI